LTAGKLRFTAVFPAKQNRCLQTKEKLSPMPGIVCFFWYYNGNRYIFHIPAIAQALRWLMRPSISRIPQL
jgi:hypothetical protein